MMYVTGDTIIKTEWGYMTVAAIKGDTLNAEEGQYIPIESPTTNEDGKTSVRCVLLNDKINPKINIYEVSWYEIDDKDKGFYTCFCPISCS